MKTKFYLTLILISLFFSVCEKASAQAPAFLSAQQLGGVDDEYASSITTDVNGNIISVGQFSNTADFDPSGAVYNLTAVGGNYFDMFIQKEDTNGNFLWAKSMGSAYYNYAYDVVTDNSGNIFVTGAFYGTVDFNPGAAVNNLTSNGNYDIFILKLDSNGNFLWVKQIGSVSTDKALAITIDKSENIILTGIFRTYTDFNPNAGNFTLSTNGVYDAFILKLDNSGNFIWAKNIGGHNEDYGMRVTSDFNNNIAISGIFKDTSDFDPGPGIYEIIANPNGSFNGDVFFQLLDSNGNFVWAHAIKNDSLYGLATCHGIEFDNAGSLFLTGEFEGTIDFDPNTSTYLLSHPVNYPHLYIAKFNNAGNLTWVIDGPLKTAGTALHVDPPGNLYIAGHFLDTVDFDPGPNVFTLTDTTANGSGYVLKLDNNGNFIWAENVGNAGNYGCEVASLTADNSGNINVLGVFYATVDFDPGINTYNLTSYGAGDVFIYKFGCNITTSTLNLSDCDSVSINGQTYFSSGVYLQSISNSTGCDSIITLNITINNTFSDTTISACSSYTSPSGNYNWTTSGIYTDTIPNAVGCDSIITVHLTISCATPPPAWQWAKATGAKDNDGGVAIGVDGLGNVYTTGCFNDTVDFDPGAGIFNLSLDTNTAFIYKSDSSGNFIWAKAIAESTPYALAVDQSGNVIITGDYSGTVDFDPGAGVFNLPTPAIGDADAFILKLDSSGNFVWAKPVSSANYDRGMAVTLDASGFIYTAGGYNSHQSYINKLNASGSTVWSKIFSGTADVAIYSIAVDGSGNVFTTGFFMYGTADFDPGTGTFSLTAASIDIFISKLDNGGNFVWAKSMQGTPSGIGFGQSIAIDASGNVYTSGFFFDTTDFDPGAGTYNLTTGPGNYDIFISKLNSSGNFVWAKSMGGPSNDQVFSLTMDTLKNIYLTGSFGATVDFDPDSGVYNLTAAGQDDIFISKINNAGGFTWCKGFGGTGYEHANSICLGPSNMVHITGSFQSPYIVAGTDTLVHDADTSQANNDILIAKLSLTCSTSSIINVGSCSSYTSPSGNYNWTNSGTYIDTIPNAAGCDSVITINLTINPLPVALYTLYPDTVTPHNWFALNQCTGTPPLSYVWNWGDGTPTSIGATPTHVYADSGYYNICVEVTDGNGCVNTYCDSSTYIYKGNSNSMVTMNVVMSLPTGIENIDGASLVTLYPNPATNHLTITLPKISQKVNVVISDITGKVVYSITDASTQKLEVNTKDFSDGVYFVQIQTADFVETRKLIIAK